MPNHRTRFAASALVAAFMIGATGCAADSGSTGDSDAQTTLERVQESGIVRVAIANEPPYTQVNVDGSITGVDPDVLREVLAGMGIETLEGVVTPFASMIPGLLADRWDVIAAGLNINPDRCGQVLFSEPVIVSTMSFAVVAGNPKGLTSIESLLNDSTATVAVMGGTFEEGILNDANVPAGQIVQVADSRGGVEAVEAGRADAFMTPTLTLNALVGDSTAVEVTAALPDTPVTGAGVAFRKEDVEFHAAYNEGLAALKATPRYAEILESWGFDAAAVEGVTTAQLCQG